MPAFISWVLIGSLAVTAVVVTVGIRDVLSHPLPAFERVGRRRSDWVIVQLVLGPVATFAWYATARFDVRDPARLDDERMPVDEAEIPLPHWARRLGRPDVSGPRG